MAILYRKQGLLCDKMQYSEIFEHVLFYVWNPEEILYSIKSKALISRWWNIEGKGENVGNQCILFLQGCFFERRQYYQYFSVTQCF